MFSPSFNRLIQSRMSARQLNLIVEMSEKGSVLHAAEAMHMTQSAASKMLISLENTLGVMLFTRQARGIEPTTFGEILIHHARCVLTQLHQAQKELNDVQAGTTGTVTVGTSTTSVTDIIPRAVVSLKKAYPGIRVVLKQDHSDVLMKKLKSCELDVVIARSHAVTDANSVSFTPISDDSCSLIVNEKHPLLEKDELTLADLVDQTWIMPPAATDLHHRLLSVFVEKGLSIPSSIVEATSLSTALNLLQMSQMIMPVASGSVSSLSNSARIDILPVDFDLSLGSPGIITLRHRPQSPATRLMLAALKQAINEPAKAALQYEKKPEVVYAN